MSNFLQEFAWLKIMVVVFCLVPGVPQVVCNDEEFIISTSVNESCFFLHPHGCTILLAACFDEYLIFVI